MNYFEDHIGDYAAATAHLTWDEDMAYTRLIRAYYHSEKPIPKDKAHRLARATTPAQRRAVDAVIEEFFTLEEDGYHQKRCDEEIARFQQKQAQEPAKKENDRDRQARARARRKAMFEELRRNGIVAPWDASTEQLQAALSQLQSQQNHAPVTRDTSCDNTATQTPDTRHHTQTPDIKDRESSTPPSRAAAVCVVVKSEGMGNVNPQHPKLLALIDDGAQVSEFVEATKLAIDAGKGFTYMLGIVKGKREDAQRKAKAPPKLESFAERDARVARDRWEQMTGETHPDNLPKHDGMVIDSTPSVLEISQ